MNWVKSTESEPVFSPYVSFLVETVVELTEPLFVVRALSRLHEGLMVQLQTGRMDKLLFVVLKSSVSVHWDLAMPLLHPQAL